MNRILEKRAFWIGGTLAGFLGVGLVRLVAPELAGLPGSVALVTGYFMVVAGLTIIACGTRRRS
jgi:hypothetical protein